MFSQNIYQSYAKYNNNNNNYYLCRGGAILLIAHIRASVVAGNVKLTLLRMSEDDSNVWRLTRCEYYLYE